MLIVNDNVFRINTVTNCWESDYPIVYDESHYTIVKLPNKLIGLAQWGLGKGRRQSGYTPFFEEGDSVEEVLSKLADHY